MMRAWREKNKLVSQMGLQFSNGCKKKQKLLIRGAIFSIYLPRIFLLEKKKLSQLVLLCCSSGNFERKFFYLWQSCFIFCLFVGWLVVRRRHFDQLIKLEPCCSINYNTYCLKSIQTKHRSKMFHKKDKFYATGRGKGQPCL